MGILGNSVEIKNAEDNQKTGKVFREAEQISPLIMQSTPIQKVHEDQGFV